MLSAVFLSAKREQNTENRKKGANQDKKAL